MDRFFSITHCSLQVEITLLVDIIFHTETCSLSGGCLENCLKGGLQVFDPPTMANASTLLDSSRRAEADPGGTSGDEEVPFSRPPDMGSTAANPPDTAQSSASNASMVDSIDGLGIFVIPVLEFPANNELCSCEAIMGFVIEDNTTFVGMYGEFPFKIELKGNRSKSALTLSPAPSSLFHHSFTRHAHADTAGSTNA